MVCCTCANALFYTVVIFKLQLQHTFGSEERLTSNCEIKICPKEDINIFILFAPTRLSSMLAKLEIKQLGIRSQPGIKFTVSNFIAFFFHFMYSAFYKSEYLIF